MFSVCGVYKGLKDGLQVTVLQVQERNNYGLHVCARLRVTVKGERSWLGLKLRFSTTYAKAF